MAEAGIPEEDTEEVTTNSRAAAAGKPPKVLMVRDFAMRKRSSEDMIAVMASFCAGFGRTRI